MISKKPKNICTILNYIEHFLILVSTFTGCISISGFSYLIGIATGITSSLIGLKICETTAGIKKLRKR